MICEQFKHVIKLYMFETDDIERLQNEEVMVQAFKNAVAALFVGKPACAYTVLVFRCAKCAARDSVRMHLVKRKVFRSCIGLCESSIAFQNCGSLNLKPWCRLPTK